MKRLYLQPMTDEKYHDFFMEYENDPALLAPGQEYVPYKYDADKVDAYIKRQFERHRIPLAIMLEDDIIGELKIQDIDENKSASFSIVMKNMNYTDKGYGTQAERLAVEYAFEELGIQVLYADTVIGNKRSQHVLEKVGFRKIRQDEQRVYFEIRKCW